MNDVQVTLVGTITSDIRFTVAGDTPVAKFRIRAQPRRYNKTTNTWQDGEPSYYTAVAWRHLAEHVASSLGVGDPVLAHGRLRISRWRLGDDPALTAEVELVSIGHDLRWGTTVYRKSQPPPLMRRSGTRSRGEADAEAGMGSVVDAAAVSLPDSVADPATDPAADSLVGALPGSVVGAVDSARSGADAGAGPAGPAMPGKRPVLTVVTSLTAAEVDAEAPSAATSRDVLAVCAAPGPTSSADAGVPEAA